MTLTVAVGHDHAGQPLRDAAIAAIEARGHVALPVTADSTEPADYPLVAAAVADVINTGRAQRGVLICGSGAGVTVAANAHPHVRAALAHEEYTARQMVEHDDVNVLALGARVVGAALAANVIGAFVESSFSGAERHARRLGQVLAQRRRLHDNALGELAAAGQSVWLDSISRRLIDEGTLALYISELYVTGVTSNPSILNQAIGAGEGYEDRIQGLVSEGTTDAEEIAFELALADLTRAADLLLPIHHATGGTDGFVSLEVSPTLVEDAAGTVEAGKRLHARAKRPNVMIKVPGTGAGLKAAEELLVAGVPVNVTLLFSPVHYVATVDAYLAAIERRLDSGLSPDVASVASVFVSRWDAAVDADLPEDVQGKLGLAMMQEILATYQDTLATPRFARLEEAGASPQRVLWASTGTKNPSLPDTYYLGRLAAPGTVDTVPEQTLLAYADHGVTCDLMKPDHAEARRCIESIHSAGVDIEQLGIRLQADGAAAFAGAWSELIESIRNRTKPERGDTSV